MSRLKVIESAEGKTQEMLKGIESKLGRVPNIFKGMANSEATLGFYMAGSEALGASKLTATEKEALALAIGSKNECKYCQSAHTAIAGSMGVSESDIESYKSLKSADEKTQSLINFALAVMEKKGFVTDAEIQDVKSKGYTDAHISEVVAVVAINVFTNYFNHVNDTVVDF